MPNQPNDENPPKDPQDEFEKQRKIEKARDVILKLYQSHADIFDQAIEAFYGDSFTKSQKGACCIGSFGSLTPIKQMYMCGYLSEGQFQRANEIEYEYYNNIVQKNNQNGKTTGVQLLKGLSPMDILFQVDPAVSKELAQDYMERVVRVAIGCQLYDTNGLNSFERQYDLDDGMEHYKLVDVNGNLKSESDLLEYMILIRKGLEGGNADTDEVLNVLADRFYSQSIGILSEPVPNAPNESIHKRTRLMKCYFSALAKPFNSSYKEKSTEELMLTVFKTLGDDLANESFEDYGFKPSDFGVEAQESGSYNDCCVDTFNKTVAPFKEIYQAQFVVQNRTKITDKPKGKKGPKDSGNGHTRVDD